MTLEELVEGLTSILKNHPELANREVCHASECGFTVAGFDFPVRIAVPVFSEKFQDSKPYIRIVSTDDGYRIGSIVENWEFISSEKDAK